MASTYSFSYSDITRKLRKNVTEAVTDLMRNFDAEFGVGHHGGHFPNRDRGFHGSDEEESSCDSSYNQVNIVKHIIKFPSSSKGIKEVYNENWKSMGRGKVCEL